MTRILGYGDESFFVAFEEIEWRAKVYQPDIISGADKLYKKLGYTM